MDGNFSPVPDHPDAVMIASSSPPPPRSEPLAPRRPVRRFDPARPVADAALSAVLRQATLASSDANLQPWRFLVVQSEPNRRRLRACAFNQPRLAEAPVLIVVLGYLNPERTHLEDIVQQALAFGAITPPEAAELRARTTRRLARVADRVLWASRSTMLAVATLELAAHATGLSTALVDEFDPNQLREAFGVSDDHAICALLALGYPLDESPFPGRLPLEEVAFLEHFGQPWTLAGS